MPSDPLQRALLSLRGLTCGDSFGESFFIPLPEARDAVTARTLQPEPWPFTDDTLMAISILATLQVHGHIDPETLVRSFSGLYDPLRGYGPAMHRHLAHLSVVGHVHWQREAQALFGGTGSFGNGSAMRVAPLGAFFADRPDLLAEQARLSAIATHSHPDAIAGAVAVALAAAAFWNGRDLQPMPPADLLRSIAASTPAGPVQDGILQAASLPSGTPPLRAGLLLGNGSRVSAADTVPLALWCAANWPDNYEEALWHTVSALGDRDTTCAIVGGIVILRTGEPGLPQSWLARAEAPWHLLTDAIDRLRSSTIAL